jgi:hypothetical protein
VNDGEKIDLKSNGSVMGYGSVMDRRVDGRGMGGLGGKYKFEFKTNK